jgi:hypothetical protein
MVYNILKRIFTSNQMDSTFQVLSYSVIQDLSWSVFQTHACVAALISTLSFSRDQLNAYFNQNSGKKKLNLINVSSDHILLNYYETECSVHGNQCAQQAGMQLICIDFDPWAYSIILRTLS